MSKCTCCKSVLSAGETTLYRCGHLLCRVCLTKRRAGCNICKKAVDKNHEFMDKKDGVIKGSSEVAVDKVYDHQGITMVYKLEDTSRTENMQLIMLNNPNDMKEQRKPKLFAASPNSYYICKLCKKVINRSVDKLHHISCTAKEKFSSSAIAKPVYDVSEPTKQDITLPKKVTTQVNIKNNQTTKINKKTKIKKIKKKVVDNPDTEKKIYECEFCNKSFDRVQSYYCHRRTHKSKIPRERKDKFKCEKCDLTFSAKWLVLNHQKDHQDYVCDYCGVSYSKKTSLKIHIENVHPFKALQCPYCLKDFRSKKHFKKHVELHEELLESNEKEKSDFSIGLTELHTNNEETVGRDEGTDQNQLEVENKNGQDEKEVKDIDKKEVKSTSVMISQNNNISTSCNGESKNPVIDSNKNKSDSSEVTKRLKDNFPKVSDSKKKNTTVRKKDNGVKSSTIQKRATAKIPLKKLKVAANIEKQKEIVKSEVTNAVSNLLKEKNKTCEMTSYQVEANKISTANDDYKHIIILPHSRKFYCKICKSVFVDENVKFEHLNCSNKIEIFKCDICDKTFDSNFQFKFHQHHTAEKFP